jgi:hypothetical protein
MYLAEVAIERGGTVYLIDSTISGNSTFLGASGGGCQ